MLCVAIIIEKERIINIFYEENVALLSRCWSVAWRLYVFFFVFKIEVYIIF